MRSDESRRRFGAQTGKSIRCLERRWAPLALIVVAGHCYRGPPSPPPNEPLVSAEYEVTDAGLGHRMVATPNPETTNVARVGSSLYFVYRHRASSSGGPTFLRRFDLVTRSFDPAVLIDDLGEAGSSTYHTEPSVLRDRSGALIAFIQHAQQPELCDGRDSTAPRIRRLPDPRNPRTWHEATCLPVRAGVGLGAPGNRPWLYDVSGDFDDHSGVTHFVGEGAGLTQMDGKAGGGLPRTYYRILPDGRFDGPYTLIEAAGHQPPEFPPGGNVFAKGDIALGQEPSGPRSLHVVWTVRNTFQDAQGVHQWNYNLYHAVSRDGGETWAPANGSVVIPLREHIQWNDSRFLVAAGDIDQNSPRAFSVDASGNPVLLVMTRRSCTGASYGGRADLMRSPSPTFDLRFLHWNGAAWVGGVIDDSRDYFEARPGFRIAPDGAWWLFLGDPMRYRVSRDQGATWSDPATFGADAGDGWRPWSYPDPVGAHAHYIVYQKRSSGRLYFVRFRLDRASGAGR